MTLDRTIARDRAVKDAIIRYSRGLITRQAAESILKREGVTDMSLLAAADQFLKVAS